MNAPAYAVVHGNMVREVELPPASPRLEQLLARAHALGLTAVTTDAGDGLHLCVFVDSENGTLAGTLLYTPETADSEERWDMTASRKVLGGFPEQASLLEENAKLVRAVFAQMVGQS